MPTNTVSNGKNTNSNFGITIAIEKKKKKNGGQPHEELMSSYQCFKAGGEHVDISIIVFILLCVL